MNDTTQDFPHFDVAVIGAGPAGAEAALAAAGAGANTICLTINLDTVGYPPASPELVSDRNDRRAVLFREFCGLGGKLPIALERDGVLVQCEPDGKLVIDRRLLGLAYKEMLESDFENLKLRQALVTSLEPFDKGWKINTRLGESFSADCVVIAAGTFLLGEVEENGTITPGGRIGEIPSNALAKCLQNMGIALMRAKGTTMPRLDRRSVGESAFAPEPEPGSTFDHSTDYVSTSDEHRFIAEGGVLGESLGYEYRSPGSREEQLKALRKFPCMSQAWITRPSYTVHHSIISANEVDARLHSIRHDGLYFAGRVSGSCNYLEAAALGLLAGMAAAGVLSGGDTGRLIDKTIYAKELCERIAHQMSRPVTVRIDGAGC